MRYLLDTNAVVYCLEGVFPLFEKISFEDELFLSFISRIELYCGKNNEDQEFSIRRFVSDLVEFETDGDITERTIFVRKKYGLKIPDAIIVATAIEKGLTLVTADKEILKKVKDIEIIDPLEWSKA
ncbi:MAG: type II toxin-antitoxin system VapC family toxin [Spirochaetales bacterium]|nr:type II toxin-antitoxin system VapC family toxin [Spirochaetales bacterium]